MYRIQDELNKEPGDFLTEQEYKEVERDKLRKPRYITDVFSTYSLWNES